MKEGNLVSLVQFWSYEIHNWDAANHVLCSWCLWKALGEEWCMGLRFHDVWTWSAKVLEY